MPENFHAETLARLIARHRVTCAFLSPSAIIDLLDDPAGAARPVLAAPCALWLGR